MNGIDIFILAVIAVSGLIALNRGLIKEVLSIIGWVLCIVFIIFLLPVLQPAMQPYVKGDTASMIASAIILFIIFFVVWIIITSRVIGKIRSSKISSLDRILGLFFGIIRACILIILFYILIGWIVPSNDQPEILKESKYFQMAGNFAEPIEKLLPQEFLAEQLKTENKDNETKSSKTISEDLDNLFDKLVQPKVKGKESDSAKDDSTKQGYNKSEQDGMDRLIDMNVE